MTTENDNLPLNTLVPVVYEAIREWQSELDESAIKNHVKKQLDRSSNRLFLTLLGLESSSGNSWKVDHCNGRSGESAAGDILRKWHEEAIEEWFRHVAMPSLTEEEAESIRASIKKEYVSTLKRDLTRQARERASLDLSALVQQISQETQTENYRALMELLGTSIENKE